MSYHYTNLGQFCNYVVEYADLRGYVPEEGDRKENFSWAHEGYDDEEWEEFVMEAVSATEEAEGALEEWRTDNEDVEEYK